MKAYYGKIIKFSQQKLCWGKTQDLILVAVFMHASHNNIINFNIIALVRTASKMYRKVYWLGFAILISDERYLHWWFLCMNDAWQLKHEYSSRSFAVWCLTYYCNPKRNKLGTCRSFQPRQSFEKFSILAFYAEKEITVMTNIKVLLKSCDIEKQTVSWVPV